ncbi:hypothetical protein G7078_10490 [Sphingomonas sinipercae]|uniref:Rap1a immunity protein domain-containing protein n=1 Tax=Sphingomonas sinipercae TaxID=2714944 RepID=A0A6G7ZQG8_9SPHN|nr:hypothetical protein [Sphingomonas sinipercae]QIL03162.1 hypothetical protein G7078_10490 [Sphingomonas sinipercae]
MVRAGVLAALVAAVWAAPASAQSMRADIFLQKADALAAKGPLALLSGDMGKLKAEMRGSAEQLRAERLAAVKAGQKPVYCPPAQQGNLGVSEILDHFRSIPVAERSRMTTKDAFKRLMMKKYPCPA